MNTIEIWKDITGFEGLYQVSNLGRVKRLEKVSKGRSKIYREAFDRLLPEKILKPQHDKEGYVHYRLTNAAGEIELWKRTPVSWFNVFEL